MAVSAETALQVERLIEVQRYGAALQLLGPAFAQAPNDPDLHCYAARAAFGLENVDDAQLHVQQALAAQPHHLVARLLLFVLKRQQKHFAAAEATILEVIREHPQDASFWAMYAELMLTVLQLDKARALAREALRCEPNNVRAQVVNVLVLLVHGDDSSAARLLASLVTGAPDEIEVVRTLFTVLVTERRCSEALEVGRQLLRFAPDDPELISALITLRAMTHWTTLPLYPLTRYGWPAVAVLWLGGVAAAALAARRFGEGLGMLVSLLLAAYVVYSWVYPPLLWRWLRRQGF